MEVPSYIVVFREFKPGKLKQLTLGQRLLICLGISSVTFCVMVPSVYYAEMTNEQHLQEKATAIWAEVDSMKKEIKGRVRNFMNDPDGGIDFAAFEAEVNGLEDRILLAAESMARKDVDKNMWTILNTLWFLIVTFATVGFGDFFPRSDPGKVLVMIFAVVGIPMYAYTTYLVSRIIIAAVKYCCMKLFGIPNVSLNQLLGLFSVITVLHWTGASAIMMELNEWRYLDAFYFYFIMVTGIGYGDLVFKVDDRPKSLVIPMLFFLSGMTVSIAFLTVLYDKINTLTGQEAAMYDRIRQLVIKEADEKRRRDERGGGTHEKKATAKSGAEEGDDIKGIVVHRPDGKEPNKEDLFDEKGELNAVILEVQKSPTQSQLDAMSPGERRQYERDKTKGGAALRKVRYIKGGKEEGDDTFEAQVKYPENRNPTP